MTPGWNQLPATNCCSWRRPRQGAEGCLHAQVSFDLVLVAAGDVLDGFGSSYIDHLMKVCADVLCITLKLILSTTQQHNCNSRSMGSPRPQVRPDVRQEGFRPLVRLMLIVQSKCRDFSISMMCGNNNQCATQISKFS